MKALVILSLLTVCGLVFNPVTGAFAASFLLPALATGLCARSYNRNVWFWTAVGVLPGVGMALLLMVITLTEKSYAYRPANQLTAKMG